MAGDRLLSCGHRNTSSGTAACRGGFSPRFSRLGGCFSLLLELFQRGHSPCTPFFLSRAEISSSGLFPPTSF